MFLQKYTGHKMCGLNSGGLWCSGMAGFCNTLKRIFPRPDQNTSTLQCLHQGVKLVWLCVNKAGSDLILNRYSWCNLNRFRKFYCMLDAIHNNTSTLLSFNVSVRPSVCTLKCTQWTSSHSTDNTPCNTPCHYNIFFKMERKMFLSRIGVTLDSKMSEK